MFYLYLYMSWTRHTQPPWPRDWNNFGFKEFKIVYIIIIISVADWLTDKLKSYKLLLTSYKIKQKIKIMNCGLYVIWIYNSLLADKILLDTYVIILCIVLYYFSFFSKLFKSYRSKAIKLLTIDIKENSCRREFYLWNLRVNTVVIVCDKTYATKTTNLYL